MSIKTCIKCGKRAIKENILCSNCQILEKAEARKVNRTLTLNLYCADCLEPTLNGRKRCEECRKGILKERTRLSRERERVRRQRKVDTNAHGKVFKPLVTDPLEYILRRCLSCGGIVKTRNSEICSNCQSKEKFSV